MVFQNITSTLARARSLYRFRNLVTGLTLAAFSGGVFNYSIQAVKQVDNFDDVDLPTTPNQTNSTSNSESDHIETPLGYPNPNLGGK